VTVSLKIIGILGKVSIVGEMYKITITYGTRLAMKSREKITQIMINRRVGEEDSRGVQQERQVMVDEKRKIKEASVMRIIGRVGKNSPNRYSSRCDLKMSKVGAGGKLRRD
jgi:hypothetical protein